MADIALTGSTSGPDPEAMTRHNPWNATGGGHDLHRFCRCLQCLGSFRKNDRVFYFDLALGRPAALD